MHQPRHHLNERGLTRTRCPIAHEGKDEPAQFGKGVQLALKIIGHQHFGQLHRLIFGNMVTHDFIGFLEGHGQGTALGLTCRRKALHHKVIRLDPPRRGIERCQPPSGRSTQCHLLHQLLCVGQHGRNQRRLILGKLAKLLIQLPNRPVQGQWGIVGQHLIHAAHINTLFTRLRRQQKRSRVGKCVKRDQRFSRQIL